ncbi:MAG: hypothetical protein KGM98_05390 [Bacteroidota bacterium]|nr:hypothetical protein [Bacteroidota bacterium]
MQFGQITGHGETKKHLTDLVQQNRLSHALLFLGKEGSPALPMALAFAQYIVCVSSKNEPRVQSGLFGPEPAGEVPAQSDKPGDSCGTCPACVKAGQYIHPDIHYSFPVITRKAGSAPVSDDYMKEWRDFLNHHPYGNVYDWLQFIGAENKQGNITVEECNSIIHKLSLKAFESRFKILIMWMPEFLGVSGNKLLKLIEEPPEDTLFILVAQDENAILPTILSRTQLIRIPLFSDEEVREALISQEGTPEEAAARIAGISEGNYREALLLYQHAAQDWEAILRDWLNVVLRRQSEGLNKWIEGVSLLGREKQKQFLRYFIHLLGQALRVRFIPEGSGPVLPENEKDFTLRINKLCGIEAQNALIEELNRSIFYIERNAHTKMLFHALSIRLFHIIKDNSLILVN